ncbi:hypothetical protein C8J57DRAFT_555821 [Mycena rebaudengoi]|jgi:hypothetical protein|nr:hypothetical protein C8J57DRAFT_555821 [Mycena rebaudengoi]
MQEYYVSRQTKTTGEGEQCARLSPSLTKSPSARCPTTHAPPNLSPIPARHAADQSSACSGISALPAVAPATRPIASSRRSHRRLITPLLHPKRVFRRIMIIESPTRAHAHPHATLSPASSHLSSSASSAVPRSPSPPPSRPSACAPAHTSKNRSPQGTMRGRRRAPARGWSRRRYPVPALGIAVSRRGGLEDPTSCTVLVRGATATVDWAR